MHMGMRSCFGASEAEASNSAAAHVYRYRTCVDIRHILQLVHNELLQQRQQRIHLERCHFVSVRPTLTQSMDFVMVVLQVCQQNSTYNFKIETQQHAVQQVAVVVIVARTYERLLIFHPFIQLLQRYTGCSFWSPGGLRKQLLGASISSSWLRRLHYWEANACSPCPSGWHPPPGALVSEGSARVRSQRTGSHGHMAAFASLGGPYDDLQHMVSLRVIVCYAGALLW